MRLIVGLGNPGIEYAQTRHNAGWMLLDRLVDRLNAGGGQGKFSGQLWGPLSVGSERLLLLKPLTYMNASGQAVGEVARYWNIAPSDILVLSDEINLAPGRLRFRTSGSAGGHNGLKSVIAHLGTAEFGRLRIGVGGKPQGSDLADHVLGRMSPTDRELEERALQAAEEFCLLWLTETPSELINQVNGFRCDNEDGQVRA